jgi:NADPH2:quinone reductase
MELAAATQLQGATAHYLCHGFTTLGPESSCLVHAGAGGVGHILIQLAKRQGAKVFATVGSPEKAAFVHSLGADVAIEYRHQSFLDIVNVESDDVGVDIVWDSVGIATIHDSIKCARRRGICILYGSVSGQVHEVEPLELGASGSVLFTRSHVEHFTSNAEEVRMRARQIFEGILEGWLKVTIDRILPLDDYAEAQRVLEDRENMGKVLLRVSETGA